MFERPEIWLFAAGLAAGMIVGYAIVYSVKSEQIDHLRRDNDQLRRVVDHYKSMLVLYRKEK